MRGKVQLDAIKGAVSYIAIMVQWLFLCLFSALAVRFFTERQRARRPSSELGCFDCFDYGFHNPDKL